MLIKYFHKNKEYASRTRDLVPRKGELVRFNGIVNIIETVVWVEDEDREKVHIGLVEEKGDE